MNKTIAGVAGALLTLGLATPDLAADEIVLEGGDTLTGTIVEQNDEAVVVDHAVLGTITVQRSRITSLTQDPPDPIAAEAAAAAAAAEEPEEPEAPKLWKTSLTLGATGKWGNTDSQDLGANFTMVRETETTRFTWATDYFYDASNGDRTDNKLASAVLQEWLLPDSPWTIFLSGQYDYDEFNSWEHRVQGHGGVKYDLIDKPDKFLWQVRAGLGAIREFESLNDDVRLEGLLGTNVIWQISERQKLDLRTTYFPDFTNGGEFRWVTRADWSILLDEETSLSLVVGLLNEYESTPSPGDSSYYDLRVLVGLNLAF